MPVMTQELKDRWIAALKSDAYPQTQRALARVYNEQGRRCYCALGVLAEVMQPGAWEPVGAGDELRHPLAEGRGTQHLSTELVSAWAQEVIVRLNDSDFETLRTIAEWVEMNVEVAQ